MNIGGTPPPGGGRRPPPTMESLRASRARCPDLGDVHKIKAPDMPFEQFHLTLYWSGIAVSVKELHEKLCDTTGGISILNVERCLYAFNTGREKTSSIIIERLNSARNQLKEQMPNQGISDGDFNQILEEWVKPNKDEWNDLLSRIETAEDLLSFAEWTQIGKKIPENIKDLIGLIIELKGKYYFPEVESFIDKDEIDTIEFNIALILKTQTYKDVDAEEYINSAIQAITLAYMLPILSDSHKNGIIEILLGYMDDQKLESSSPAKKIAAGIISNIPGAADICLSIFSTSVFKENSQDFLGVLEEDFSTTINNMLTERIKEGKIKQVKDALRKINRLILLEKLLSPGVFIDCALKVLQDQFNKKEIFDMLKG